MTVCNDVLDARDVAALGRIHVDSLPQSSVSLLGEGYARAFYRFVEKSADEILFVERAEGADGRGIIGACVVSLRPGTLNKRLLVGTSFLFRLPFALPRIPWRKLLGGSRKNSGLPRQEPLPWPEIILIFMDGKARSRGIGGRLLRAAESWLSSQGISAVTVRTLDSDENRAIRFYENLGFVRVGNSFSQGKSLAVFRKALAA